MIGVKRGHEKSLRNVLLEVGQTESKFRALCQEMHPEMAL